MFSRAKQTVVKVIAAAAIVSGCQGTVGQNANEDSSVNPSSDAGTGMEMETGMGMGMDTAAASQDVYQPVDAPAAAPATLRMVFPISGATTATTVTARGTTDGQNVASVTVNGSAATSADGFRTWKASVPLSSGENTITAVLERSDQSQVQVSASVVRAASEATIKRGKLLAGVVLNLMGGSVDPKGTAMYLADANADAILRIDVVTGDQTWATCSERSAVCGNGPSNGVPFTQPMDVVVDEARQRAFVVDGPNVFAVDLSGKGGPTERTMIAGPEVSEASYTPPTYAGRGNGPQAQQLGSMSYDPVANVIYAVDWGSGNNAPVGFFKIDPETGNRQVLSNIGQGGVFRRIAASPARGILFSTAAYQSTLTKVSLADGMRSTGPSINEPQALAASDALGFVFAVDKGGSLIAFNGDNLSSRTVAPIGGGAGFSVGGGLIFLYGGDHLAAFDPDNGERIVVSR